MPDYSKGQIYKITDVGQTKCYIGSTIQKLCYRMTQHRINYRDYLEGKVRYCSSFSLFNEFGIENCKILWVKNYPCNSKKELEAEEGRIQQETECVNKRVAGRTIQEWYDANKEHKKTYSKIYSQNNPEINRAKCKKWRQTKGAIIIECACGLTHTVKHKARHEKTKKHQQYLQNQNNPQE